MFREGPDAGNDVPLVSRWTGSLGVALTIWQRYLIFDGVVRYIGERRMDNDQHNIQPLIPYHTVVDVGLSGEIDRFYWSFKVQNLFNVYYFDYAVASPFPEGFQQARQVQRLSAAGPRVPAQSRSDLPVGGGGRPATQPAAVRSKDRDG